MPAFDRMARNTARKLAAEGRLVEECFATFQRAVYPGAPHDVAAQMRICFFAGAAEFSAMLMAGTDDGDDISAEDEALLEQCLDEIETHQQRTIALMLAKGPMQ